MLKSQKKQKPFYQTDIWHPLLKLLSVQNSEKRQNSNEISRCEGKVPSINIVSNGAINQNRDNSEKSHAS